MGRPRVTAPDRPMPGRRMLDGSRALARLMRAGKIDRRTAPAKALDQVVAVLVVDWGGSDRMPGAARLLADRIGVLTVRLMLREQRLMREAAAGIDDPSSDKHTIALHNAFSRSLQRLDEMRARDGQREHGPTLAEYLAQRSNTPADAPPAHAPDAVGSETPATPADAPSEPVRNHSNPPAAMPAEPKGVA